MTETARQVFLRLVSVDDDSSGTATRRRALVVEVEELDDRGRVAATARHVRTAPAADVRPRPRHARADGGDLPRGAADGVDHAAELDRRRPGRPADAPPARRRDERVDGSRPLTGLPPPRRSPRRHRRVGRDDDDGAATGRAPVPRRQPGRARRGATRARRRRSDGRPRRSAGPGAAPASSCSPRPSMAAVVGAGDVRLGAAAGRPSIRSRPHRQPGRATSRHALGEHPVHRPRAGAAAGQGGGVGDGGPRLRPAGGDRRRPLGPAGARRAVRRHHRHARSAARSGPGGVRGVWVAPGRQS